MQTPKSRRQFYLSRELTQKLEALAGEPRFSKSAIMTEALTGLLQMGGAHELDARFGRRLDQHGRTAERMERKLEDLIEALGLFVRHQLTLMAQQPAFEDESRHLGRLRYDEFVRPVGRLGARGEAEPATGELPHQEKNHAEAN